jgi:hypothetical protein
MGGRSGQTCIGASLVLGIGGVTIGAWALQWRDLRG